MHRKVISYQTKPESTDENAALIRKVFAELKAAAPAGVSYMVLRTEDGVFTHHVAYESEEANDRLTDLPAFDAFRADGAARRLTGPDSRDVELIGFYGTFTD